MFGNLQVLIAAIMAIILPATDAIRALIAAFFGL